ncbi:hypothetical protein KCP69_06475 [Salmonella enterica subsp. enterica]|nr:hypothetical protein KCP69_06475 [Salmonella enterica subsp. enterica]
MMYPETCWQLCFARLLYSRCCAAEGLCTSGAPVQTGVKPQLHSPLNFAGDCSPVNARCAASNAARLVAMAAVAVAVFRFAVQNQV